MEGLTDLLISLGTNANNTGRICEAETPEGSANQYNLLNLYNIIK